MYQKIKNSLFYPKEIATSYKGRVIGFIIFLIGILSLPFILNICINGFITSNDIRNTKLAFYESTIVEYRIENHKLVPYEEITPNKYIVVEEGTFGIAFINQKEEAVEVAEQIVIVLQDDGIHLSLPFLGGLAIPISDYEFLDDIDFKDAKTLDNNDFWQTVLILVNDYVNNIKFIIYPVAIIFIIMVMAVQVLLGILINTGILLLFERTPGVRFKDVYKNSTVAFFPYIIGMILAYGFGVKALTSIGNIIAFIYALIAHNEYRRIKIKENM